MRENHVAPIFSERWLAAISKRASPFKTSRGEHPRIGLDEQLPRIARRLQRGQPSGGPDFRRLEDLRALQAFRAAALELAGDGADRGGGALRQGVQPRR